MSQFASIMERGQHCPARRTELARWRSNDGSGGNWSDDRIVRLRRGVDGEWEPIGKAPSSRKALVILKQYRDHWRQIGYVRDDMVRKKLPKFYDLTPRTRLFENGSGLVMQGEEIAKPGLRLGRMAAYAVRAKQRMVEFDKRKICVNHWGMNPKESLFEPPVTVEEIREAIASEHSPLSDEERRLAAEEYGLEFESSTSSEFASSTSSEFQFTNQDDGDDE